MVHQRVFPTEICNCDDVIEDSAHVDEGCGWCAPCKAAARSEDWNFHDDGYEADDEDEERGMTGRGGTRGRETGKKRSRQKDLGPIARPVLAGEPRRPGLARAG